MALEGGSLLPGRGVPQADGLVLAAGDQRLAIGGEQQSADPVFVTPQRHPKFARLPFLRLASATFPTCGRQVDERPPEQGCQRENEWDAHALASFAGLDVRLQLRIILPDSLCAAPRNRRAPRESGLRLSGADTSPERQRRDGSGLGVRAGRTQEEARRGVEVEWNGTHFASTVILPHHPPPRYPSAQIIPSTASPGCSRPVAGAPGLCGVVSRRWRSGLVSAPLGCNALSRLLCLLLVGP